MTSLIEDALALAVANVLLDQAHCVIIQPGERHWEIFTRLCTEADARGNLVDDAWFAALAMVNHRSVPNDFVVHPGDRLSLFPREVPIFADWLDHRF